MQNLIRSSDMINPELQKLRSTVISRLAFSLYTGVALPAIFLLHALKIM